MFLPKLSLFPKFYFEKFRNGFLKGIAGSDTGFCYEIEFFFRKGKVDVLIFLVFGKQKAFFNSSLIPKTYICSAPSATLRCKIYRKVAEFAKNKIPK